MIEKGIMKVYDSGYEGEIVKLPKNQSIYMIWKWVSGVGKETQ